MLLTLTTSGFWYDLMISKIYIYVFETEYIVRIDILKPKICMCYSIYSHIMCSS